MCIRDRSTTMRRTRLLVGLPDGLPPASRKVKTSGRIMKNNNSAALEKRMTASFQIMANIFFILISSPSPILGEGRGECYFCTRFFFPNSKTEARNKIPPIVSRAVIGVERFVNVPPNARVVKPSNAHEFGVMRLKDCTKGCICSRLTKLPPRMPKINIIAVPTLLTWAVVRANAVMSCLLYTSRCV